MDMIWMAMIAGGIVFAALTGNGDKVTNAIIDAPAEAVNLCITMLGIMGLWLGIMRMASDCGLIDALTRLMRPVIKLLFPKLDPNSPACRYIAANFTANLLGLGWAATPYGLKAMKELKKESERKADFTGGGETAKGNEGLKNSETATDEMCTFLIINMSSLQLIPVSVIAYRSRYGSVDPSSIIGPGLAATFVSTLTAVIFCIMINRKARS